MNTKIADYPRRIMKLLGFKLNFKLKMQVNLEFTQKTLVNLGMPLRVAPFALI